MQYKNSSIPIARAEAGPASPNDATIDKLNTHRVAKGKARKKRRKKKKHNIVKPLYL